METGLVPGSMGADLEPRSIDVIPEPQSVGVGTFQFNLEPEA